MPPVWHANRIAQISIARIAEPVLTNAQDVVPQRMLAGRRARPLPEERDKFGPLTSRLKRSARGLVPGKSEATEAESLF